MSTATAQATANATTTSPYKSGEFHPGIGRMQDPGQLVQLGNMLLWVGNSHHSDLYIYSADLSSLLQNNTSNVKNGWNDSKMRDSIHRGNLDMKTSKVTGSATIGNRAFFFWADKDNGQIGSIVIKIDDQGQLQFSTNAMEIQNTSGSTLTKIDSDVSAFALGETILLSYVDSYGLQSYVLDPNDLDIDDASWKASFQGSTISFKTLNVPSSNLYSSDWFTLGPDQNFMMAGFYNSDHNKVYSFVFPLSTMGTPMASGRTNISAFDAKRGVSIKRDPAGRMMAFFGKDDSNHRCYYRIYNTLDNTPEGSSTPVLNTSFGGENAVFGNQYGTECAPQSLFVTALAEDDTVTLPTTTGTAQFSAKSGTVYQYLIYCDNNSDNGAHDIKVQIGQEGKVSYVPEISKITPENSELIKLNSIMDPFPMPQSLLDQNPSAKAWTYYGIKDASSESHAVDVNVQMGIKANYTTTQGLGPAMDFQFKAGPALHDQDSVETILETSYGSYAGGYSQWEGGSTVVPFGELFGKTLPYIFEDGMYYIDNDNDVINGAGAPLFGKIRIDNSGSENISRSDTYQLLSSSPGDLSSYEITQINSRMANWYNDLSNTDKENFTSGYASNYFYDVILPNAFAFGPTSESDPEAGKYLEFVVGIGQQTPAFEQITSKLHEWGWDLNTSLYAGVSGGVSVSVGIGVLSATVGGASFEALAGFEFQGSSRTTEETQETIGVTTDIKELSPYSPSYTVRLYMLNASDLWANEILYMGGNLNEDLRSSFDLENSKPMKFFFRVL